MARSARTTAPAGAAARSWHALPVAQVAAALAVDPATGLSPEEGARRLIHELVVEGKLVRFAVDPDAIDHVLGGLTSIGVRSLTATPPTLEELFLRHYRTESDGR